MGLKPSPFGLALILVSALPLTALAQPPIQPPPRSTLPIAQGQTASVHVYATKRRPRPCDVDLSLPKNGPPSVAQATKIFLCGAEKETEISPNHGILTLADAVSIRIAPTGRKSTVSDAIDYRNGMRGIIMMDRTLPVYDAKIGYIETVCHSRPTVATILPRKTCKSRRFAPNTGLCFRDSFGDWHCRIHPDSWRGAVSVDMPE